MFCYRDGDCICKERLSTIEGHSVIEGLLLDAAQRAIQHSFTYINSYLSKVRPQRLLRKVNLDMGMTYRGPHPWVRRGVRVR